MTTENTTLGKALKIVAILLLVFAAITFVYGVVLGFQSGTLSAGGFSVKYFFLSVVSSLVNVLQSVGIALLCLFASKKV